jgi:hypothetical protein
MVSELNENEKVVLALIFNEKGINFARICLFCQKYGIEYAGVQLALHGLMVKNLIFERLEDQRVKYFIYANLSREDVAELIGY